MVRQLFLHVGTQKTGTTSLQQYLVDHEQALARSGLGVVREVRHRGPLATNCARLADAVLRPNLLTIPRSLDLFPAGHSGRKLVSEILAVRAAVRQLESPRLLISSEALCFARTRAERARIRTLVRACRARAIVILCVRNTDDWRASWEDQLDKVRYPGAYTPAPHADVRRHWYYDIDAIAEFWSAIGHVRVIPYDEAMEQHGSIIPAVLDATGTNVVGTSVDYSLNRRRDA